MLIVNRLGHDRKEIHRLQAPHNCTVSICVFGFYFSGAKIKRAPWIFHAVFMQVFCGFRCFDGCDLQADLTQECFEKKDEISKAVERLGVTGFDKSVGEKRCEKPSYKKDIFQVLFGLYILLYIVI